MRAIPNVAVDFIAAHEGCRLTAYKDSVGVWTIGYGSTLGVGPGMTITQDEAKVRLKSDLGQAADRLAARIGSIVDELTENQYAALLSFVFNVGSDPAWGIWKRLNARQFDAVPVELMRFVNAGGRKLQGLVNRRADEVKLWSTDEPGSTAEVVPSSVTRVADTPPTSTADKPLAQSKTLWAGGTVAAAGAIQSAQQIQALAAPQAANNAWIAKLVSITAFVVVAGGVAIMVFKWLEQRSHRV